MACTINLYNRRARHLILRAHVTSKSVTVSANHIINSYARHAPRVYAVCMRLRSCGTASTRASGGRPRESAGGAQGTRRGGARSRAGGRRAERAKARGDGQSMSVRKRRRARAMRAICSRGQALGNYEQHHTINRRGAGAGSPRIDGWHMSDRASSPLNEAFEIDLWRRRKGPLRPISISKRQLPRCQNTYKTATSTCSGPTDPPLRTPVFSRVPLVPLAADNSRSDLPPAFAAAHHSVARVCSSTVSVSPLSDASATLDPNDLTTKVHLLSRPGERDGKTEDAMSLELWSITVTCSMRCAHRHASMSASVSRARLGACPMHIRLPPSAFSFERRETGADRHCSARARRRPQHGPPNPTARPI